MIHHYPRIPLVLVHRTSSRRASSSVSTFPFSLLDKSSTAKYYNQFVSLYSRQLCTSSFGSRRFSAQPDLSPLALGLCGGGTTFDASVLAQSIREEVRLYTSNLLREGKGMCTYVCVIE